MNQFDPNAFLDLPVDTPFERRKALPAIDYTAQILSVNARQWQSKDKYDEATGQLKSGVALDVEVELQIPESVKAEVGLQGSTFKLKESIMVDANATGGIDTAPGRNQQLMRWREACDMNKPGIVFRPREMAGKLIKLRIKHEEYPAGSGQLQERVGAVAKI